MTVPRFRVWPPAPLTFEILDQGHRIAVRQQVAHRRRELRWRRRSGRASAASAALIHSPLASS